MQSCITFCKSIYSGSNARSNETIPFVQREGPCFEADVGSESKVTSSMEPNDATSRSNRERRATVGGIEKPTISAWDAGWNVANAIQGMFVLGLPVAIRYGGYNGVLMIALAAILCFYTGKILVSCLYETTGNELIRVRNSYFDVAVVCWGRVGGHIVNVVQLIELLMTCVLYIVVSGNLMKSSFPNCYVTETEWSIMCSLVLFLCIFLRNLKAVSRLSFGCSVAQFVVMGMTIIYCFSDVANWKWSKLTFSVNGKEFPVSIGVIVFSYTSQIFLPSLEGSMEQRSEFPKMLCWSYVASCAVKEVFALVCFLTWAENTKDVVTDNLPAGIRAAVNIVLMVKAVLSYPLPFYQSIELIEQSLFTDVTGGWGTLFRTKRHHYTNLHEEIEHVRNTSFIKELPTEASTVITPTEPQCEKAMLVILDDKNEDKHFGFPSCYNAKGSIQPWAYVLRSVLVLGTLIMAIYIPHFALLMGFTGSLTGTLLAFLLPCSFHLKLKWNDLTWVDFCLDVAILIFGFFCAFTGLYYSIIGLYEAFHPLNWPGNFTLPLIGNVTKQAVNEQMWFPDFPKILNTSYK